MFSTQIGFWSGKLRVLQNGILLQIIWTELNQNMGPWWSAVNMAFHSPSLNILKFCWQPTIYKNGWWLPRTKSLWCRRPLQLLNSHLTCYSLMLTRPLLLHRIIDLILIQQTCLLLCSVNIQKVIVCMEKLNIVVGSLIYRTMRELLFTSETRQNLTTR